MGFMMNEPTESGPVSTKDEGLLKLIHLGYYRFLVNACGLTVDIWAFDMDHAMTRIQADFERRDHDARENGNLSLVM